MSAILALFLALSIGLAAYAHARAAGVWSWRRFLATVAVISVLGGGTGFLLSWLGRRAGPEHALALTALAVGLITLGVVLLALRLRRR